ncbi:ArsR/SmtB family transcription factor [Amphibacillus jilinensis]|uniref:ArsR/SmtB family transcription factor n=1 Tax=Amphibacillus jilinensis TaxID=1216008 RepID=UPI0003120419|nr:metalloregulator ArsR/SmtB family transcription factor [Amphibacillus jilinensis]
MNNRYQTFAKLFKTLADPNRLKIIDILSCGEKCACDILEEFQFTQPTLSHHMKVLIDSGLVNSRKQGLWHFYRLNPERSHQVKQFLTELISETDACICHEQAVCSSLEQVR